MTWALHETGARVVAVEKDRGLATFLADQYRDEPNVDIVEADVLAWDPTPLLEEHATWTVVANLPYNVATPILFHLLRSTVAFRNLHVMVQREVAERMTARPGTAAYGVLTIRLALLATVEPVLQVPPEAFFPSPKVRSTVVRVTPAKRFDTGPPARFRRLVDGAFAKRRKTLRNALLAHGFPADSLDAALERAGIDGKRRGETLEIAEFCTLNKAFDPS